MQKAFNDCQRCGKCCRAITCGIGFALLGAKRPCPALEYDGNLHRCGLVRKASDYLDVGKNAKWKDLFLSKLFSHMLGVGAGCCSSFAVDANYEDWLESGKRWRFDTDMQ